MDAVARLCWTNSLSLHFMLVVSHSFDIVFAAFVQLLLAVGMRGSAICEKLFFIERLHQVGLCFGLCHPTHCCLVLLGPWLIVFRDMDRYTAQALPAMNLQPVSTLITAVAAVGRRCGVLCCAPCPWARPSLSCTIVCP